MMSWGFLQSSEEPGKRGLAPWLLEWKEDFTLYELGHVSCLLIEVGNGAHKLFCGLGCGGSEAGPPAR